MKSIRLHLYVNDKESEATSTLVFNSMITISAMMVAFAVGMMMPNHVPSEPVETEELSVAVIPPAVLGKCVMDDVKLNRIESDLVVAQQIAWDWISI